MPVLEHIPSMRASGISFVVAASDSPDRMKRVADYVCDGTADDVQIQAAIDALPGEGGVVTLAPGTYNTTTTVNLNEGNKTILLSGYGAQIVTSGAIWAVTVDSMGSTTAPSTLEGIQVNQRSNSTALGGFRVIQSWNTRLRDCTVVADGTNASYVAAIQVENGDAADGVTGSFWTTIENCWIRKFSGGDTGTIPIGINLLGHSNATRIIGGGINNCDDALVLTEQGAQVLSINHVYCNGVAFETNTDCIVVDGEGADSGAGSGLIVIGCRFETATNLLHVANRNTTGWARPPFLAGNEISSNVTNYVTYTSSSGDATAINTLDFHTTGNHEGEIANGLTIKGGDLKMDNNRGIIIGNDAQVTSIGNVVPELQVLGTAIHDSAILAGRWSADASAPRLLLLKSRNATIGSNTIVQDNDNVGAIQFMADDGTDYQSPAASIIVDVDGTPGTNDMPGRIEFHTTPDGSASSLERMVIKQNGRVGIGISTPDGLLHVENGSAGTVDANANADDLVVEVSGGGGMSILTPNNVIARILFGDPDDNDVGQIRYNHSTNVLDFVTNATVGPSIESNGILTLKTFTNAARPAAGTAGRVIFNTDDGQLNIDDGTNWTLPDGTTT